MTTDPDLTDPELNASSAGRQVRLTPVPPGIWLIIGGGLLAALGPMFGFLIGSVMGSTTDRNDLSPIYLFLFGGIAVGGLGIGAVLLGARRVIRERRESPAR